MEMYSLSAAVQSKHTATCHTDPGDPFTALIAGVQGLSLFPSSFYPSHLDIGSPPPLDPTIVSLHRLSGTAF
jgi:hypothetical protein